MIGATRPTLAALRFKLADLEDERRNAFLWSDYALTNGTIRRIDDLIYALKLQIEEREQGAG